jgi:hypothetical protein
MPIVAFLLALVLAETLSWLVLRWLVRPQQPRWEWAAVQVAVTSRALDEPAIYVGQVCELVRFGTAWLRVYELDGSTFDLPGGAIERIDLLATRERAIEFADSIETDGEEVIS